MARGTEKASPCETNNKDRVDDEEEGDSKRKAHSTPHRAARRFYNYMALRSLRAPSDSELVSFTLACLALSAILWVWYLFRYLNKSQPFTEYPIDKCERLSSLSPLDLYYGYVLPSRPVVIAGGALGWAAMERWQEDSYLRERVGGASVRCQSDLHVETVASCERGRVGDVAVDVEATESGLESRSCDFHFTACDHPDRVTGL